MRAEQAGGGTATPAFDVPAYTRYLVFCDESGTTNGLPFYGFGGLWFPWQRRGDFAGAITELKKQHGVADTHEIKWGKCNSGRNLKLYKAVVDYVFSKRWIFFHAIIFRRAMIDIERFHGGSWDLAFRKHYGLFLRDRIGKFSAKGGQQEFEVRVDKINSSYGKAAEASHKILKAGLAQDKHVSNPAVKSFLEVDSAESAGVQVCDLLLGAALAAHQGNVENEQKKELMAQIARHLGWPDLLGDTWPDQLRFNIWYFWAGGRREVPVRPVQFLNPLSIYKGGMDEDD